MIKKVYEFCGWLNTPDECAGAWFDHFSDEPRVSYYDRPRGCDMCGNFRAYIINERGVIQKATRRPVLRVVDGYNGPVFDSIPGHAGIYTWDMERVGSFLTADGRNYPEDFSDEIAEKSKVVMAYWTLNQGAPDPVRKAARAFIAKEIGFAEFKRIVRENS